MDLKVIHYYPRALMGDGGCTAAVRGWVQALADAGAEVTVVCDLTGEPPAGNVRWRSAQHRGSGRLLAPVGLERLLGGNDLLIIHSGWAYHNLQAARAAARMGLPYLITPHGAYEPNVFRRRKTLKKLYWQLFEKQLVMRARAIHVHFNEQALELTELGYRGPVVIAPNGVKIPELTARENKSDYVLWMGRFDIETKGLDLLLQGLASMQPATRPRTRLHGPDWRGGKQQTAQLVRDLGLEEWVSIGPPLYGSDKWDALRECGVFVFPARWDGQSVMLLEAAAAGARLVVTNTTPVGRYIAAHQGALLVDAQPAAIASGMLRALSSEANGLGARASQVVRERFSWPVVAASYAEQLRAVL